MFAHNLIDMGVVKVGSQKEVWVDITDPDNFDVSKLSVSCGCTKGEFNKSTSQLKVTINYNYRTDLSQNVVTYKTEDRAYQLVIKAKVE